VSSQERSDFSSLFDSMSPAARVGSCRSVSMRTSETGRDSFEARSRDVPCHFVTMRSVAEWLRRGSV